MAGPLLAGVLRRGGRLAQAVGQLAPGALGGGLDAAFRDAAIDWNGARSCLLLSFDVDFPEDCDALPAVAAALARHGIRASFACVGRWVEEFPDAHRAVVDGGHELVNHSYSHPELVNAPGRFASRRADLNDRRWEALSLAERAAEIEGCQRAVALTLGVAPRGFRAPHFGNVDPRPLYPVLAALGLAYSTSMLAPRGRRFGVPVYEGTVLEIPVTTCPRHPLSSLDTWHALYARGGWHRDDFGDVLRRQLARAVACGGLTNIYLDPKDAARFDFDGFLATAIALGPDVWVATYSEVTDRLAARLTAEPAP